MAFRALDARRTIPNDFWVRFGEQCFEVAHDGSSYALVSHDWRCKVLPRSVPTQRTGQWSVYKQAGPSRSTVALRDKVESKHRRFITRSELWW
jgi:hypothetical protein